MSLFRLRDPDCVLIHIPKTGGTAIRKGSWQGNYDGPEFSLPDEWQPLFKFAFVRHPFDRLISAWKMFSDGISDGPSAPKATEGLSLVSFCDIVCDESISYEERRTASERIRHHAIPQTHPFNALHMADFVGRFETLQEDFDRICAQLEIQKLLPHRHVTKHDTWQSYMSPDVVERMAVFYAEDFRTLNYSPEP